MARKRKRRRISKIFYIPVAVILLLVAYFVWTAWDQHKLFTKYNQAIEEQNEENAKLRAEIKALEDQLARVDDRAFIKEQALKLGMEETDLTPVPIDLEALRAMPVPIPETEPEPVTNDEDDTQAESEEETEPEEPTEEDPETAEDTE